MSSAVDRLTCEQWATLLNEVEPRTFYQLVDAVDDIPTIDTNPEAVVETAIDRGALVVDAEASGNFEHFKLNDANTLECSTNNENHDTAAESNPREPDSNGDNPGGDSAGTLQAAATAALDDAVSWFNQRIDDEILDHTEHGHHSDRPTTAREWFAKNRRFTDDTIDEKRLGWAPADATDQLIEYLTTRGHSREAIKATGLFTDDLRLLWNGRYIFPYFDEDGSAVYAIARATGGLGGGAAGYDGHPEDFIAGKYAKLAHTKEYTAVEEPIFGLSSLDRDGPVIITEGVADAIRAHEYGYACLSPVTTQFKKKHREQLAEILKDSGRRTYIVQDAERPVVEHTNEVDGWDALGLEQYGEGLKGAARTAAFLAEEGVDAYLAELPRLGLDKVDLDDYLADWSDNLAAVLAGAKPGSQHPVHDEVGLKANSKSDDWNPDNYGGNGQSDAAELTEEEVANALDHVSRTLSYDNWIQLGYAVHAWNPGRTGRRLFTEWSRRSPKWSEPVSPNAIEWIWHNATAGSEVTVGTLIARAKEGGWEPPRWGGDAHPVAALGVNKLESLDPDEQRRAVKKRGHDIPTTREARQRLRDSILREIRHENTTVLDAPTALGKSYTIATEPWLRRQSVTGGAPVIHLHPTREARDEAASETADSMATGEVLLGRKEASPVARGDHDPVPDGEDPETVVTVDGEPVSEWFDRMCDEKGLAFSTALAIARERNDQQLEEMPPFGEEDPAVAQWDNVPRTDDGEPTVDVLHATDQFAHVPSMRTNTNVVLDELPDFAVDLTQDRIRRTVIAYLKEISAPTTSFEAFVSLARNEQTQGDAAVERDAIDEMLTPQPKQPATEWYVDEPDAHALAPGIAKAIWSSIRHEEPDCNGRRATRVYHEPPRFDADGSDYAAGTWLSIVVDDDNTVQTVRATPDFRQARSVVGLDAHPSMPLWELNATPGMTRDSVLDATERRLWRRFERGLKVVQVGDATRPRSGAKATDWMSDDRVRAVLKQLREHYGDGFKTAITTKQTERRVRNLLDEATGGSQVDADNTMHFGEEKSRNDFADEQAGYVYGCMDPGDEMVLNTLAELGLDATPETAETEDGETVRAKGREFEGEDAEKAAAVLASVRESHVAQAAGRYARNADGDHDATVYLHTDAAPARFVDAEMPGVEWIATDLQRDVINNLNERAVATAKEIADAVDCSKKHVLETLSKLEERGLVERERGEGYNGADLFHDEGGTDVIVDDDSTTNDRLLGSNRWSVMVELRHVGGAPLIHSSSPTPPPSPATTGGDAPPDRRE